MYRVASASEYLVITGFGIADIKIAKKGWVFPWHSCAVFDMLPVNYTFEVRAMSAEKFPFILQAVFTIGPKVDDDESLHKYAKLISPHDKLPNHVKELVQGIIEEETCVLAASMTMEEIFRGTKEFKGKVFEKVQLELYQFGLMIYKMNVKQLVEVPGHEYFAMQRQGAWEKEEIRVRTQVAEANAKLAKKKARWTKEAEVAQVEATKLVALREAELQGEVERMNALTRTNMLKVEFLSKVSVEYETKVQEAKLELYRKQKVAEAVLYEKEKEAEAQKVIADAEFYAKKRKAEALVWEALGGNYEQRSAVASRARGGGVEGERRWRRQGQAEVAASRASSGGVEQRSVVGRGRAAVASSKGQRQRAAVASSKGQRQRTGEKRTVS